MTATHTAASRQEWLAARTALLHEEKELTRRSDELARKRQALPWVEVTEDYRFDTERGEARLTDLFGGNSQLIVYHFMFGPDYTAGCPSCSMIADGFNGFVPHLVNHDVAFWAVSRAPLDRLLAYRERMGWSFPWASSAGGVFNADFNVTFTEAEQAEGGIEYNFRSEAGADWGASRSFDGDDAESRFAAMCGTDVPAYQRQRPGMSAFARKDGRIFHTYSAYARGLDVLWGAYQWLDRAPLGRNEAGGVWSRRRDEY